MGDVQSIDQLKFDGNVVTWDKSFSFRLNDVNLLPLYFGTSLSFHLFISFGVLTLYCFILTFPDVQSIDQLSF